MREQIKRVSYAVWTGTALAMLTVLVIGTLFNAALNVQVVA